MKRKKLLQSAAVIGMTVFLCVCGTDSAQTSAAQTTKTAQTKTAKTSKTVQTKTAKTSKTVQTKTAKTKGKKTTAKTKKKKLTTKQAFGKALWDLYQLGKTPDGEQLYFRNMDEASCNRFAIQDIDGDGEKELIIDWETGCVASMVEIVYGCKDGKVYTELEGFPSMRFFDDGAAEIDWSHNQGKSGDFWPYFAYHYNAEKDVYEEYGFVEAWDRKLSDANPLREAFPTEIDLDGDGFIYHFVDAGEEYSDDGPYVDGDGYETWRRGYRSDDAKKITVKTKRMTAKRIKKLGYPRPYVKVEEPKG